MTFLMGHYEVGDFDAWKRETFDADPGGRRQAAKGHVLSRSLDNPNEVFVAVEFDSREEAEAFRERLHASGALETVIVRTPITLVEVADRETY